MEVGRQRCDPSFTLQLNSNSQAMTRQIAVISGKGGTGKTTLVSNLGVALSQQDRNVLLVDANISGANLGQHFGLERYQATLNQVLRGQAFLTQALYKTDGLSLLPAAPITGEQDLELLSSPGSDPGRLPRLFFDFIGSKDYIVIDAGAGVGTEVRRAIRASDEVLIVTEPDRTSISNALSAKKLADSLNRRTTGVIINKVGQDSLELETSEVERALSSKVLAEIGHSKWIRKSLAIQKPLVAIYPGIKPAREFKELACQLTSEDLPPRTLREMAKELFINLGSKLGR